MPCPRFVRHPAARRRTGDAGSSIVEVLVASLLLGLMAVVGTAAVVSGQGITVANRARVVAAGLAARDLDFARQRLAVSPEGVDALVAEGAARNAHPLDDGGVAGEPYVVDGTAYTVERVAATRLPGSTSACEGGAFVEKLATEVTVTVTWERMGTADPYVLRQLFAPHQDVVPIEAGESLIAVAVTDHRGRPASGITASIAPLAGGPALTSAVTDASGCAVARVQPGAGHADYTVTLSAAGWAAPDGTAEPTKDVVAVQGQTVRQTEFEYARTGTLTIRLRGAATSTSMVTIVHPDAAREPRVPDAGSGGTRITIADAYPGTWGAYAGLVPPSEGGAQVELPAGGTASMEVVVP